jgi:tetratricopeptide (TPR) repeat protein
VPVVAPKPKREIPKPAGDAKSAAAHNQLGRDLLNQGKYQEAIAELTVAIAQQPDFALAYNARGFGYYLMRDYKNALADLDEAIRLNPNYANAYHNRSLARRATGDRDGAAVDLAKERELTAVHK